MRISKALGSTSLMTIILSLFSARGPSNIALKTGDLSASIPDLAGIFSVHGETPIWKLKVRKLNSTFQDKYQESYVQVFLLNGLLPGPENITFKYFEPQSCMTEQLNIKRVWLVANSCGHGCIFVFCNALSKYLRGFVLLIKICLCIHYIFSVLGLRT
jgi:hypothetical protein